MSLDTGLILSYVGQQLAAALQPAKRTPLKTSRTISPTHNELRTKRPMW